MTDILCRWLNDELQISQVVDQGNFAREFASGFLVGEVLNKYQLQNDFDQFSQSKTADSKLNNFTRIEPVLHLLGIPFDTNLARDVMTEKHGVATRLMYQLYIALNNKKKANLTGVAMETMRPAAPAKLNAVESGIYKERLKHATPRQTDLDLDELVSKFHDKQIQMEETAFEDRFREQERIRNQQQDQRQALLERSRKMREKQSEIVAKIQAATVKIPKPPPEKTAKAIQKRREIRRKREAAETIDAVSKFEDKMKMILPPSKEDDGETIDVQYILTRDEDRLMDAVDLIKPASNDDYIGKIRKRLQEDESARAEREKRRRKVLVDQMKAHEGQEEARREEMLVNRLMRQSQQERRIAVQLLQARHEKDIIRKNRIYREKQYEERRLRDFEDALNKEAEMAKAAKKEYEEQTKKDQELHDKIAAERAEARYRKHYDSCNKIVNQMVDFTCKVAEYRELTEKLVPAKLFREWQALFVAGVPLYEQVEAPESTEPTPEQILEEERQLLLDEGDFTEYKSMAGEWQPPEGCDITAPPRDNPIVGHVVQRLFNMVHPPSPPAAPPEFPPFPIRACILGKVFSGKSTVVQKLAHEHRLQVLDPDILVDEAVEAHKNGETMIIQEMDAVEEKPLDTATDQQSPAQETPSEPQVPSDDKTEDKTQEEQVPSQPQEETAPTPAQMEPKTPSPVKRTRSKMSTKEKKPVPTPKAKLGAKALKYLKKGQPIDDQVIVDILVESIRRIPEGTGWILDGFPTNYNQAKVLEKALTGFSDAENKKDKNQKSKKSNLAPDPRPPQPPPDPSSGLDVVVLFDVVDELCLKRAAGRSFGVQSNESYHQEFKPPPYGSSTGIGKQEQVVATEDPAHDQDQIQQRITRFLDSWPKLEKWYSKFGTLQVVDAAHESRTVFLETEKILEDTVMKLQKKDEEPEPEPEPVVEKPEEPPQPPPEPPKEEVPEEKSSRPSSRKGSGKKSRSSSKESRSKSPKDKKGDKREKSSSPKRSGSSKKSEAGSSKKGSRGSSPKSPGKRGKGSGKKSKTPEPEPEPEPTGPPPPQPGSEEWEFVDLAIENDLADVLAKYWETVEATYVGNSKQMFRKLRGERENIYRYFYQIKKDYLAYLRRPDNKQVYVNQWQKEYNDVSDDMRDDEETKAELHQRVDDLRMKLWDICDERKAQAEKERQAIIDDGWLDDRLGVLSNYYITQMQAEVDRFQDTVRLLKDYYRGMEGHIPDDLNTNYARVPLIELPVERPESPDKAESVASSSPPAPEESVGSAKSGDRPRSSRSKSGRSKSPRSPKGRKSRTPSAKKRDKSKEKKADPTAQSPADDGGRKKIPLVPRRPMSPDPDAKAGGVGAKDKNQKKTGKKDDGGPDSPAPPMDPDEKLIYDGYQNGVSALAGILQSEYAAKEAEEEAERRKEEEREREKAAAAQKAAATTKKGGKKGKSRSPSPKKKNDAAATPPPPSEELSEEDKEKKMKKDRLKQEFYFAIQEEETAAKTRLELIKAHSIGVLQDLKSKADNAFKEMNDWLGARFLKEMGSIDEMSEVVRFAIENKQKLKQELVLHQQDFLVNEDLKVLQTPSPPPPPLKEELTTAEQFTVNQLMKLYGQFTATAPSGVMSKQSFMETFENMVSVAFGMEQLPDLWMNISPGQILEIASGLSADAEYVDWRRFLLAVAQPIQSPTQTELLETLQRFKEMDQKSTGYVTREQYDRMDLWFGCESQTSEEFDRLPPLKAAFFDFFADHSKTPPSLDYVSMLMYTSATSHAGEGFLRALSVASGTHMPRLPKPETRAPSIMESHADFAEEGPSPPPVPDDIPEDAVNAVVPLDALYLVLHHGESARGDSHRFSVSADPEDATSREKLVGVFQELGSEDLEPIPYRILLEHPLIQDIVSACQTFRALDIKGILSNPSAADLDLHSTKTME